MTDLKCPVNEHKWVPWDMNRGTMKCAYCGDVQTELEIEKDWAWWKKLTGKK